VERLFAVLLHQAFAGDLTAKWRDAHMKELLAEMEEQVQALEVPIPTESAPEIRVKRHAGHDMFNKAALAAYIVAQCHTPEQPIGRVKLAKLFYLVQRRAELALTQSFARRAAGPLDDDIHKFLNLAKKKGWVKVPATQGDFKPLKPGDNLQPAIDQVRRRWIQAIPVMDDVLNKMKTWGWEVLERCATVEQVAQDILAQGKPVTANAVLDALANVPEWKTKLDRESFSEEKVAATIEGLRKFGFLPPATM
jgi:hypothetical protein